MKIIYVQREIFLTLNLYVLSIMAGFSSLSYQSWIPLEMGMNVSFEPFVFAHLNVTYESNKNHSIIVDSAKEIGRYGDTCIASGFGNLYHVANANDANDHTGCQLPFLFSVRGEIVNRTLREPWVALIKRGSCSFRDKVSNAFTSNASGVIIYNDRQSNSLDRMKLQFNRNISAIFTYKWKGEELSKLTDEGFEVFVSYSISIDSSSNSTINRLSLWLVSSTFIILWILSLAWLIFYYIQRFRYLYAKDRLSRHLCNAAKRALSKIPLKNIKSDDKEIQGDGECCAICIEHYKITEILRILPCNHEFHKNCIDPWLLNNRTCPMCKMDILKHYGFVISNSTENVLRFNMEEIYVSTSQLSPLPQIAPIVIEVSNSHGTNHDRYHQITESGTQSNAILCAHCLQNTANSNLISQLP